MLVGDADAQGAVHGLAVVEVGTDVGGVFHIGLEAAGGGDDLAGQGDRPVAVILGGGEAQAGQNANSAKG